MLYVINHHFDENNNEYPNYYIDNNNGINIYYDIYLDKIDEKDYNKFGINKSTFSGSGSMIGGMMVGGIGEAEEEKQEDSIIEASQWTLIKNILLSVSYQAYFGMNFEYKLQSDKLIKILLDKNLYIKWGKWYYTFKNISNFCIKEIAINILCQTNVVNIQRKAYYSNKKNQNCLNIFCLNSAKYDEGIKQRQECSTCEGYRNNPKATRPIGFHFKWKEYNIGEYNIREIIESIKYVDTAYTNMCHNNFNPSYWDTTTVKRNGNKLIEPNYKFEYINKKDGMAYPIKINGKDYRCELMRPWNSYGKGIIELDHINGKHQENSIDNINPLCKICHAIKTDLQQDKANKEGTGNAATIRQYTADYDTNIETTKKNIKIIENDINDNIKKRIFTLNKKKEFIPYYNNIISIWNDDDIPEYKFPKSKLEKDELAKQHKIEVSMKNKKNVNDEQVVIDEIKEKPEKSRKEMQEKDVKKISKKKQSNPPSKEVQKRISQITKTRLRSKLNIIAIEENLDPEKYKNINLLREALLQKINKENDLDDIDVIQS